MSHTPGPWATHKTEGNGGNIPDRLEIVGPEEGRKRSLIASIYGFKLPEGQANARLIAAAPELLETCESLLEIIDVRMLELSEVEWGQRKHEAEHKAKSALAKVRGDEGEER